MRNVPPLSSAMLLLLSVAALAGGCHHEAAPSARASATPTATTAAMVTSSSGEANAADAGSASPEPLWIVHDNGKRCIVAPCPSWTAVNVDTRASVDVAKVDFAALRIPPKDEAAVREKVLAGQAWARGTIMVMPKMGPAGDGKVLQVSGVFDAAGKQVTPPE